MSFYLIFFYSASVEIIVHVVVNTIVFSMVIYYVPSPDCIAVLNSKLSFFKTS